MIADTVLTRVILFRKNSNVVEFRHFNRRTDQTFPLSLYWGYDKTLGKFKGMTKSGVLKYQEE